LSIEEVTEDDFFHVNPDDGTIVPPVINRPPSPDQSQKGLFGNDGVVVYLKKDGSVFMYDGRSVTEGFHFPATLVGNTNTPVVFRENYFGDQSAKYESSTSDATAESPVDSPDLSPSSTEESLDELLNHVERLLSSDDTVSDSQSSEDVSHASAEKSLQDMLDRAAELVSSDDISIESVSESEESEDGTLLVTDATTSEIENETNTPTTSTVFSSDAPSSTTACLDVVTYNRASSLSSLSPESLAYLASLRMRSSRQTYVMGLAGASMAAFGFFPQRLAMKTDVTDVDGGYYVPNLETKDTHMRVEGILSPMFLMRRPSSGKL
jgi:hypothetical protein